MTLPVALSGTDIIGQAKTGTGKTLGFGLPLLERVTVPADVEAGRAAPEMLTDAPQALVVVPTRELCTQVTNDLLTAGKVRNVRVTAIYGGRAYEPQVEALRKGVDVVVGTPGRLLDLAGQKKLDLKHVRCLVLDEADEMLDLGFLPDVEKIMAMLPARRQTMLFSATMPGAVIGLARRYMSQPTHIRATSPDDEGATVANTAQYVYRAHSMDKPEMVSRILQAEGRALAMVFCRTKRTAADIAEQLERRGFASGAVHGDLGQGAREQALRAFRNGKVDVLVCTDVAARGIDVENVTHVINYQSPEDEKTYLHRIGRTGRAGASGTAITLVDWDDIPRWQLINKALDLGFNDPPETYSTSPHLFEDLKIPAGTKGVLPRSERLRAGLDAEELEDLGEPGGRSRGRGGRSDRDRRGGSGDRDRDRRGGRGESAPPVEAESERPSRTPRRRRRTRNGSPLEQGAAPVVQQQPAAVEETAPAGRTPRRRRRTRSGAQESAVTTPVTPSAEQAPAAEVAVETAEGQPRRRTRTRRGDEQPVASVVESESAAGTTPVAAEVAVETAEGAPRRRTRTRKESTPVAAPEVTAAAVVETVEAKPRRTRKAAAEAVVEAVAAEVVETKPRRTRKAAAAPVEAAEAVVDVVEAKPRRTRKTAEVAPVVEAPVEAAPRRTRKTAAAKAAVDTAEAVETKPRRTRKTAATKAAEAVVEAAEAVVEAVEAKPRRTRKTAATKADEAAPVAEAPAEAVEAAPRRTRKTAAAKAAEAAVDTAEAVETKPRRTRKTAATKAGEAAVETAEAVVEAKPRRTRKTAATKAAEAAVDTAEAVETKPRRTRKTAAPSEAPVEAVEEAKPRRRTTRKAATAAEIPAQATEEPVVKPRRTRKAAAVEPTDG
ncbi:DEAD/DEAH box helicase [Streptomyces acidiscabies]|uniref:RNA helicase n=5 Tax=Streptomyces acidiscabies TaxID=42234 RepID=A0AAP6B9T8_9ACTN|nr:DEAD/DEAH box helicase [Streptomyces acidiscabies]MDX2960685.1 DEAD/DEAH box helicase [Streptomyces acidiscabies]MDX3020779.1 DEAD/DEAH box helicase [Streptomyces acidiscabies]MDX3792850.1 DEAD/DEAH box helicase [Streptomyces acidiscabies]GAQ55879.1 DEAD-box ATP-dependent RNA helicase CshA [Streptomyces acidiscabies]